MSVLFANKFGWIISHEKYINDIYRETDHLGEIKSYCLNCTLFDIKIPFVKKKKKCHSPVLINDEINTVKKSYINLNEYYKSLQVFSNIQLESNHAAKSFADNFYCELTRHPNFEFHGGNTSEKPLISVICDEQYLIPGNSSFYCYDIKNILHHLKDEKFDLILMDPPWWNKFIRRKRRKNSKFGYDMVYDNELLSIPITSLLNKDGIIGVWCTSAPSHVNSVINELFPAWNMKFLAQWFWIKVTKFGEPVHDFSPPLGKQPFERILFGIPKNSVRKHLSPETDKVFMSIPSAIHSHKPPLNELFKSFLPERPKCLELFARYLLPGWTSYGNEVLKLQHISLYKEVPCGKI